MKTLAIVMKYLPYALAGVQAVEEAMPTAPGASKKAAVLAGINAASKIGEQVPEPHVAAISALIDALVGAFNTSGFFSKVTPARAA